MAAHIIDLNAGPYEPEGWRAVEHNYGGQLEWDPTKVLLYLSEHQQGKKAPDGGIGTEVGVEGNELFKELAEQECLNANVLDHLLRHPKLIPEEWKGKRVLFPGTKYRRGASALYIRYLYWYSGEWRWGGTYLFGRKFDENHPTAVLAA